MTDRDYTRLVQAIEEQLQQKGRLIVAIDGRCGSGKSTLAARLARELRCSVFHMDDFFPRPGQRTAERLSHNAQPVTYRPYLCARQQLGAPVTVPPTPLTMVEGSYACHPTLREYYGLRVFLTVAPEEQLRRIESRNGPEKAQMFRDRWIPFEEMYFQAFDVQARCDIVIQG